MEVKVGSSKLEVDDGSSRLDVEVGCSRIFEDGIDSSIRLEVKADMEDDSSSILEVEADIEADITSSRGRCCCITEGFFDEQTVLSLRSLPYLAGSTQVEAGEE